MVPEDIKQIARVICRLSQLIFEKNKKKWCVECGTIAQVQRPMGDPLNAITMEMLMGTGPYSTTHVQMTFPAAVLGESMRCAKVALQLVPPEKQQQCYVSIKQSKRKLFGNFTDQLTEVLMSEPTYCRN